MHRPVHTLFLLSVYEPCNATPAVVNSSGRSVGYEIQQLQLFLGRLLETIKKTKAANTYVIGKTGKWRVDKMEGVALSKMASFIVLVVQSRGIFSQDVCCKNNRLLMMHTSDSYMFGMKITDFTRSSTPLGYLLKKKNNDDEHSKIVMTDLPCGETNVCVDP